MAYDISLNTIRNFIETVRLGNITNAAEKMNITQPTLSKQISQLEECLQFKLLHRMKTGVVLTAEGEIFFKHCLPVVDAYDRLEDAIEHITGQISGKLTVGYQKASERIVSINDSRFTSEYPNIKLENVRQSSRNFLDDLQSGSLDVAYIYEYEMEKKYKDIVGIGVGELTSMLLVSANNPLAKRDKVHLGELQYEHFILPSLGNSPRKSANIERYCNKYNFSPQCVARADIIIDYVTNVIGYNGVTILPYLPEVALDRDVKYLELEGFPSEYPIFLSWNKTNKNPILQLYIDFIEQQPFYYGEKLKKSLKRSDKVIGS